MTKEAKFLTNRRLAAVGLVAKILNLGESDRVGVASEFLEIAYTRGREDACKDMIKIIRSGGGKNIDG